MLLPVDNTGDCDWVVKTPTAVEMDKMVVSDTVEDLGSEVIVAETWVVVAIRPASILVDEVDGSVSVGVTIIIVDDVKSKPAAY